MCAENILLKVLYTTLCNFRFVPAIDVGSLSASVHRNRGKPHTSATFGPWTAGEQAWDANTTETYE